MFFGLADKASRHALPLGSLATPLDGAARYLFRVPAGTVLPEAITLPLRGAAVHLCIVLEENALADLALFLGTRSKKHVSCVTEIFLARGTRCTFLHCTQTQAPSAGFTQAARLADESSLHWHNATFDTGHVTHTLATELRGLHAESSVRWAFYASHEDMYQFSVCNVFRGRNGGGDIIMRGIAADTAVARCNGKIDIGPGGAGTQTYLTQNVLMLDPTAKVDAVPALEIRTNDVKASHSATVAKVSEEDLFTFAARGIPAHQARSMFIEGFLGGTLTEIPHPSWRRHLSAALLQKSAP